MYDKQKTKNTKKEALEANFWYRRPFSQFTIVILWLMLLSVVVFVILQWVQIIEITVEDVFYKKVAPPNYLQENISRINSSLVKKYTKYPFLLEERLNEPFMGYESLWDKSLFIFRYLNCELVTKSEKFITYIDIDGELLTYSTAEWVMLREELFNWFTEQDARIANWQLWLQYEHLLLQSKIDSYNFQQHLVENRFFRKDYSFLREQEVKEFVEEVIWLSPQGYNRETIQEAKLGWSWEEVKDYEKRKAGFEKFLDEQCEKIEKGEISLLKGKIKVSSKEYFKYRVKDQHLFSNKRSVAEELGVEEDWILK